MEDSVGCGGKAGEAGPSSLGSARPASARLVKVIPAPPHHLGHVITTPHHVINPSDDVTLPHVALASRVALMTKVTYACLYNILMVKIRRYRSCFIYS